MNNAELESFITYLIHSYWYALDDHREGENEVQNMIMGAAEFGFEIEYPEDHPEHPDYIPPKGWEEWWEDSTPSEQVEYFRSLNLPLKYKLIGRAKTSK